MIKFVYFDVGGVVIKDFSKTNKWNEMLADLGLEEEKKEAFGELFGKYENEICKGQDTAEFIKAAEKSLGISFPQNYSMLEDFVKRFEVNSEIHPIINKISQKYKIGLLTNMYTGMLTMINQYKLMPEIDWDVVVDSSIVKFKKPEDEIFQIAEERAGVNPEEILFVENTVGHVDAAAKRGWKTFLYDPAEIKTSNARLADILL